MKNEIAGMLDAGMECFYHLPTSTLEWFPDEMKHPHMEYSDWAEIIKKVKKHQKEYVQFEGMETRESLRVMEDFIDEIRDRSVQEKLANALDGKKPFQQFKNVLLYYPNLRQQWFAYKDRRILEYVEEQLERYNSRPEE